MDRHEVTLTLPADEEHVLLARMAASGLAMLAGLEIGLIDDVRSAVDESCDCLLHQPAPAERQELDARVADGRLLCRLKARRADGLSDNPPQDLDVTRGVLETLMPDVSLESDERGVYAVAFSLPVPEDV